MLLVIASLITLATIWLHDLTSIAVQWTAIRTVGLRATNCGYVRNEGNPERANACVQAALQQAHPFRVVYQFYGRDSLITTAIMRDVQGHLFWIAIDSMGDPVPANPYFFNKLSLRPCAKIVRDGRRPSFPICVPDSEQGLKPLN